MRKLFTLSILAVLTFCCAIILSACSTGAKDEFEGQITISQVGESQQIMVSVDTDEELFSVTVDVREGNNIVSDTTFSGTVALRNMNYEIPVYAYYGKHSVSVTAVTTSGQKKTVTEEVAVTASEYNFAPLTGSMPVLLFSLSVWEIAENIPTFVWLDRAGAWDYNNMPANVYILPTATQAEYTAHQPNDNLLFTKTKQYIKKLHEVNPESKFNVYMNDHNLGQYLNMLVANEIPANNYELFLLSDGAHSYNAYNNTFNVADATSKHARMTEEYFALKEEVAERGFYDYGNHNFSINADDFRSYAFTIVKEESNVQWWLPRANSTDLFKIPKDTTNFISQFFTNNASSTLVLDNVKVKAINTLLLNNIQNKGREEEFKKLYKFNDEMFAKAETEGKKTMMFLGSHTNSEPNLADYVNLMMNYYGDEYIYYYKGHPNSPTDLDAAKRTLINDLGLIDVESTIAAELILFYFPDLYMCGYASTTFLSVQIDDMACALFNTSKASANSDYKNKLDMFVTSITSTNSLYGSLCTSEDTYYLMEVNDTTNYDFAIYNATQNIIKYYNNNGDVFTEVL